MQTHEVRLEPSGICLQVREDQAIVEAALEQGIAIHHGCGNGSCGDCKGTILAGDGEQLPFMPLLLTPEERASNKAILCKLQPRTAMRIAATVDESPAYWQGRVSDLHLLGETVMELRVDCDRPYPYRAGQYARLAVPGAPSLWRSYSMASAPREDHRLHFHIRKVPGGKFSEWLFDRAQVGEEIMLSAAQGEFTRQENDRPLLCIAAGTGLAPIEAILEDHFRCGERRPIALYFGVRQQRDLYHLDFLEDLASKHPELRLSVSCSDPELSDWSGPRRLLPAVAAAGPWQGHEAYLCGSPGMIEAAIDLLLSHGMPHEQIHFDSFSPSA